MPLTSNQQLYAMYVIGTVESNCNWTSVNYNDPITIGMMQWYGTRAAGILNRVKTDDPDGYALLAASLRASVDAHAASDSWWTTRYLTKDEGNSWIQAAQRDDNHVIQQDQFMQDLQAYESTLTGWGCATDTPDHIKSFIFCCSMYHQSPRQAGRVVSAVGGQSSVSALCDGALNDSVLHNYRNRYTTVRDLLNGWDGTSAPPDFGQVGEVDDQPGGDSGDGLPGVTSQIRYARLVGDVLYIYGKDAENGLVCYKSGPSTWLPQRNSAAPDNPSSGSGDSGATSGQITQMQDLWRQNANKWSYSQGAGRLDPPSSGYSDCSACIWWAVNSVSPATAASMGTWTGAMVGNSWPVVAQGTRGQVPDVSQLQAGDIIIFRWSSTSLGSGDHVEWVFPNGELWGAGRAPLPHDSGSIQSYFASTNPGAWMVKRMQVAP